MCGIVGYTGQKSAAPVILDGLRKLIPVLILIPLQLLAYHIAVIKRTDVDHPRNPAKSVTVE